MPDEKKKDSDMVSETPTEGSVDEGKDEIKESKVVLALKDENAKRRVENTELRGRLDKIEKERIEQHKALLASLGIKDEKEDPIKAMQSRIDSLAKELEDSTKNTERERLFNTFVKEALKAGVNPDLVDDAWKLTDGVTFDNVTDAIKGLKEKKGFLFGGNKDVGREIAPGKGEKSYPEVMTAIAQDQRQPIEWIEEKAKEYMKKHPEVKSVEQAALRRFGKPTIVGYKPRTE